MPACDPAYCSHHTAQTFVEAYNKKHADNQLELEQCHVQSAAYVAYLAQLRCRDGAWCGRASLTAASRPPSCRQAQVAVR